MTRREAGAQATGEPGPGGLLGLGEAVAPSLSTLEAVPEVPFPAILSLSGSGWPGVGSPLLWEGFQFPADPDLVGKGHEGSHP